MSIFENQKILVDDPLYTEYDLSEISDEKFVKTIQSGSVDAYCPRCDRKSVFRILGPESYQIAEAAKKTSKHGLIVSHAKCVRQNPEGILDRCEYDFYALFHRSGSTMVKIGQHPSKADSDFGELDDAFKELSASQRKEFGAAIGLFSHGIGIGSFVYLRRIFERLIEEAYENAVQEESVDQEEYAKCRMVEKIKLLKDYLPSRLVKSSNLYGVLSKGIHELSEDECKEKFSIVKQAIQLILKQKHEEKEYEKAIKSLQ